MRNALAADPVAWLAVGAVALILRRFFSRWMRYARQAKASREFGPTPISELEVLAALKGESR